MGFQSSNSSMAWMEMRQNIFALCSTKTKIIVIYSSHQHLLIILLFIKRNRLFYINKIVVKIWLFSKKIVPNQHTVLSDLLLVY